MRVRTILAASVPMAFTAAAVTLAIATLFAGFRCNHFVDRCNAEGG